MVITKHQIQYWQASSKLLVHSASPNPINQCYIKYGERYCNILNTSKNGIITTMTMKLPFFQNVMPCSQIKICRCFRVSCCLHHHGTWMEAACSSENFYQPTWQHITEHSKLHPQYASDLPNYIFFNLWAFTKNSKSIDFNQTPKCDISFSKRLRCSNSVVKFKELMLCILEVP